MNWHVVTRVGSDDNHVVGLADDVARISVGIDRPGDPWAIGHNLTLFDEAGLSPPAEALDLLNFSMSVYAADLVIPRRLSSDRWRREITLHLPVTDVERWREALSAGQPALEFLTGDSWTIELRPRQAPKAKKPGKLPDVDAVALFSGGLDSLVGAIDLLAAGKRLALVGHHGLGITNTVQDDVLVELRAHFAGLFSPFLFYVQPRKPVVGYREVGGRRKKITDGEQTMRSRSLLFASLGVAVAASLPGKLPLVISENGFISLNVPLTITRLGSASTRTTHPYFLALFADFVARLGLPSQIETPYAFHTKGEMLQGTKHQAALAAAAPKTVSCSHPEHGRFSRASLKSHCGYCVPCIIRRAATMAAATPDGTYRTDLTDTHQRPDSTSDSGSDLRAFEMAYLRAKGRGPRTATLDVLSSGPLPPERITEYAGVYIRGLSEVGRYLGLGKGL